VEDWDIVPGAGKMEYQSGAGSRIPLITAGPSSAEEVKQVLRERAGIRIV
jgi:hypothetical protein